MALTINSVFEKLNGFFLEKYATNAGVVFRFDRIGVPLTISDFADANAGNGIKRLYDFSWTVNRIPVEDQDKVNIVFTTGMLPDVYYNLLQQSLPWVPPNDPNREIIVSNFNTIKSKALKYYETRFHPGGPGEEKVIDPFYPSHPMPENWFDDASSWKTEQFQVKEKTETPGTPKPVLWRLKLEDAILNQVVEKTETETLEPRLLHRRILERKKENRFLLAREAFTEARPAVAPGAIRLARRPRGLVAVGPRRDIGIGIVEPPKPKRTFEIFGKLQESLHKMDLVKRAEVNEAIKEQAPVKPSETTDINISLEYCVVHIQRPWYNAEVLKEPNWYLVNTPKGSKSQEGMNGLSLVPTAFIAVRNLEITAQWSDVDIEASRQASDFGPFEVNTEIMDGKLSHPGTQIIGWMLERMPQLPPNDPPTL